MKSVSLLRHTGQLQFLQVLYTLQSHNCVIAGVWQRESVIFRWQKS
jgi:hypothetical protein